MRTRPRQDLKLAEKLTAELAMLTQEISTAKQEAAQLMVVWWGVDKKGNDSHSKSKVWRCCSKIAVGEIWPIPFRR
ncbi:hypothetical protein IC615_00005 [Serratia ureilytica]